MNLYDKLKPEHRTKLDSNDEYPSTQRNAIKCLKNNTIGMLITIENLYDIMTTLELPVHDITNFYDLFED